MSFALPGVYVEIRGDYSKLKTDLDGAKRAVQSQARGMSDALNNALSPRQITSNINSLVRNLSQIDKTLKTSGQQFKNVSADLKQFAHQTGLTERQLAKLQTQMLRTSAQRSMENSWKRVQSATGATNLQMVVMRARMGDLTGSMRTFQTVAATGFHRVTASVLNFKTALLGIGVGMGAGKALGEFADFDKGLIAVKKTTGLAGKDLEEFGRKIQDMSVASDVGIADEKLLAIAEAAGTLGISGQRNLLKFTKTIGQLESATDLHGEEAAKTLARILNVTNESTDSVDVLGSVIVALGNNMAASEREIAAVGIQVAQATAQFGTSSAEAMAMGAALKSMGVQAELGGSAVGRSFRTIDSAIRDGGDKLTVLERLTGETGDQLKQTFQQDATRVFQKFIEGLGKAQASGQDTTKILAAMGLQGEEILKVLPTIAKRSDELGRALRIAGEEIEHPTALIQEAIEANKSFSAQMRITGNVIDVIASDIGAKLAPEIVKATQKFRKWVQENDTFISKDVPNHIGKMAESFKTMAGSIQKIVNLLSQIPAPILYGGIGALLGGKIGGKYGAMGLGAIGVGAGIAASIHGTPSEMAQRQKNERATAAARAKDAAIMSGTGVQHGSIAPDLASEYNRDGHAKAQSGLINSALIAKINASIVSQAIDAMNAGVSYELRARDMSSGKIDCSGFVQHVYKTIADGVGKAGGGLPQSMKSALTGTSESMIENVAKLTGDLWQGSVANLDKSIVQPGMLMAFDTGSTNYDSGRTLGIDHIAMAVKDATGAIKLAQSASSAGGVALSNLDEYLAKIKSAKVYLVDPLKNLRSNAANEAFKTAAGTSSFTDVMAGIKDKSEAKAIASAIEQMTVRLRAMRGEVATLQDTLAGESYASRIAAVDRKWDDATASLAKGMEKAGDVGRQVMAEYEKARGLEKQIVQQQALREQAQLTASQLVEIAQATGDYGVLRQGWEQELKNWQSEQERVIKSVATTDAEYADLTSRMKQQAHWRELAIKKAAAKNYAEYSAAMDTELPSRMEQQKRDIWESSKEFFIQNSQTMRDSRLRAYDEIVAAAKASGEAEQLAMALVLQEAQKLEQLQFLQQYGSSDQAFNATLGINFGTFKSEMTRAREMAVTEAEAISQLFTDIGSSITGSFSSIIEGLINGTMTWEDAVSEVLGSLANAFMNCFTSIFQSWLQNQIGSIIQSLFSSGSSFGGGFGSIAGSIGSFAGSVAFAQGGAFASAPGLSAYSNSVVSSPTIFPFASGGALGLAGEAGPEAIMPLTRMPNGNLGVEAKGGKKSESTKQAAPNVTVKPKIINVFDPGLIGQWAKTDEGEKVIMNVVRRNGG